jgi:hypothetical protein
MKCYAIMHTGPDREKVIEAIDKVPEIVNWRSTAGAIFVVSEKTADWITNKIHKVFPEKEMIFLISPLNIQECQGYLDQETWDFLRTPKRAEE